MGTTTMIRLSLTIFAAAGLAACNPQSNALNVDAQSSTTPTDSNPSSPGGGSTTPETPAGALSLSSAEIPTGESSRKLFSIAMAGTGATYAKVKVASGSVDCRSTSGYGSAMAVSSVGFDLSSLPDGAVTLCVWAGASATNFEPIASAESYSWTKVSYLDIAAGPRSTCYIRGNGKVYCFGINSDGQLGNGNRVDSLTPQEVVGVDSAIQVVIVGGGAACALSSLGAVKCWGRNNRGQLGDGTTDSTGVSGKPNPVAVSGLSGVVEIAAHYGRDMACARLSTGAVKCWGSADWGNLGNGATGGNQTTPSAIASLTAKSIAVGGSSSCAVSTSGAVSCWGPGDSSTLGNGTTGGSVTTPTSVLLDSTTSLGGALRVRAGQRGACAQMASMAWKCWGQNDAYAIGTTSGLNEIYATDFASGTLADDLVIGDGSVCAVLAGGSPSCVGHNEYGQLGSYQIAKTPTNQPIGPEGIFGVQKIAMGPQHYCAIKLDGRVVCWGSNFWGMLKSGVRGVSNTPRTIALGSAQMKSVTTGANLRCGIDNSSSSKAYCWGNANLALGMGASGNSLANPTDLSLPNVASISTGELVTCASLNDGSVKCWGSNNRGGLGLGYDGLSASGFPTTVPSLTGVAKLAIGSLYGGDIICALTQTGRLSCWGQNGCGTNCGSVGVGDSVNGLISTPTDLGLSGVLDVAVARQSGCAIRSDGTVVCWGSNDRGQMGYSGSTAALAPGTAVTGISTARKIVASSAGFCTLLSDKTVKCWGGGSLGDNGQNSGATPVSVVTSASNSAPLGNITKIGSWANGYCAFIDGQGIYCWGDNNENELLSLDGSSSVAKLVVATTDVADLSTSSTGSGMCYKTISTGVQKCWGTGSYEYAGLSWW